MVSSAVDFHVPEFAIPAHVAFDSSSPRDAPLPELRLLLGFLPPLPRNTPITLGLIPRTLFFHTSDMSSTRKAAVTKMNEMASPMGNMYRDT